MTAPTRAGLDIAPVWQRFNESLIRLVDYVPDDKMNWSPKRELWNFRGILLHITGAREGWLLHAVKLDEEPIDPYRTVRTKDEIKDSYARSWRWVQRLISDRALLDAEYDDEDEDGSLRKISGHWIAWHLIEHDIHHRADIFHYLALLGIETPDVATP
jgi:uncharacterized damage-inducible protein DinB